MPQRTLGELYHSAVLSLRAYLLGISKRIVLPIPGTPNGGRPINAGYRMYGRIAGPAVMNMTQVLQISK